MKFDNYLLPIREDGDLTRACENTCLLYILYKLNKEIIDEDFSSKYTPRPRLPEESFEEYDDFLTQHLHAYEQYLAKLGKGYLLQNDEMFYDRLQTLSQPHGELFPHPSTPTLPLSEKASLYAAIACSMYGFQQLLPISVRGLLSIRSVLDGRKTKTLTYITDSALLFNILILLTIGMYVKNMEDILVQLMYTEKYGPTFISRLAKHLFTKFILKKRQEPVVEWVSLWEPVLSKYF